MTMMVQRVAQQLHDMAVRNGGVSRGPSDMVADARALIAAMRDPADDQVNAVDAYIARESLEMETSVGDIWQRMIDAALA